MGHAALNAANGPIASTSDDGVPLKDLAQKTPGGAF